MSAPSRLLAKSTADPGRPPGAATLAGHTALVLAASKVLIDERGTASLRAVGLPLNHEPKLSRCVRLAALVHDLGKCSAHFQEMVRRKRERPQLMRHEAVSIWLCWPGQPLADWLSLAVADEDEYLVALAAAAGHHRKFWAHAVAPDDAGAGTELPLWNQHDDFTRLLQRCARELDLGAAPALEALTVQVTRRSDPRHLFARWQLQLQERLRQDPGLRKLLAATKALVLCGDVAGSALPRAPEKPDWIRGQLARRAGAEQLRDLVKKRLQGAPLRPFQEAVANSSAPLTLARAGCGTGKTIAAYEWAARQHPGRQLWITYPTTGTATEGFRDYVHASGVAGRLEHSRASVDVEIFDLVEGNDPPREQDRLDALRAWGSEVVTCTVDTVLGLTQNQRKGLYAWPGLVDSAVVFDEVHAYDDMLFGCLLRFLEDLPNVPALLMTASLPDARTRALRDLAERTHHVELADIEGPGDLEELPRYRRQRDGEPGDLVSAALEQGEKVLWVSNTVQRCMAAARSMGLPDPLVYHSRFRYRDRVARHGAVIEAFRRAGGAAAFTTQVAEMSLDLSADLLVTDLAPVPAMIQRLGRLNRRSTPADPRPPKPFLVLPFAGPPYERRQLDGGREWLERLPERLLSQRDLADAWDHAGAAGVRRVASAWLDGGLQTLPAPVREASPGLDVVLPDDAAGVRSGEIAAVEVALPMGPPPGRGGVWVSWPRARHLPVPPPNLISYDERWGASWLRG